VCAKCGWRISARYGTGKERHDYVCQSRVSNYAGDSCQGMAGGEQSTKVGTHATSRSEAEGVERYSTRRMSSSQRPAFR